jgi:hypothetical protein
MYVFRCHCIHVEQILDHFIIRMWQLVCWYSYSRSTTRNLKVSFTHDLQPKSCLFPGTFIISSMVK